MLKGVEVEGLEHVVEWCSHGRAFMVHAAKEFVDDILPRYVLFRMMCSLLCWCIQCVISKWHGMPSLSARCNAETRETIYRARISTMFLFQLAYLQILQTIQVYLVSASVEPLWLPARGFGTRSRSLLPPAFPPRSTRYLQGHTANKGQGWCRLDHSSQLHRIGMHPDFVLPTSQVSSCLKVSRGEYGVGGR